MAKIWKLLALEQRRQFLCSVNNHKISYVILFYFEICNLPIAHTHTIIYTHNTVIYKNKKIVIIKRKHNTVI